MENICLARFWDLRLFGGMLEILGASVEDLRGDIGWCFHAVVDALGEDFYMFITCVFAWLFIS